MRGLLYLKVAKQRKTPIWFLFTNVLCKYQYHTLKLYQIQQYVQCIHFIYCMRLTVKTYLSTSIAITKNLNIVYQLQMSSNRLSQNVYKTVTPCFSALNYNEISVCINLF